VTAKIALVANTAWYLQNFRRTLIRRLLEEGYSVITIAPPDEYVPELLALGAEFHGAPMDSKGANPFADFRLAMTLRRLFREARPSCVLTFTVKPNVYGAFAAASLGIPVVCNVSGLGTAFIRRNWITSVVKALYRSALRRAATVFFQNPDDLQLFLRLEIVSAAKTRLLPGSGVDVDRFAPSRDSRPAGAPFRFLLLGRLLWDKGVGELVEAARELRSRYPGTEFFLVGFAGTESRSAISLEKIQEWVDEGLITYVPPALDVRPFLASSDCVVLPSFYAEGTPRSLLEASSMARPIITTDMPGCRQVVEDQRSGYLVPARDSRALADAMERMLLLSADQRRELGLRGRQKMVREFDERIVMDEYMRAITEATSSTR
jgi:glycosyltransferase involved in cell wall biosynthesis